MTFFMILFSFSFTSLFSLSPKSFLKNSNSILSDPMDKGAKPLLDLSSTHKKRRFPSVDEDSIELRAKIAKPMTKSQIAIFSIDGEDFEFPLIVGSKNERAIDGTDLRKRTQFVFFDPGFGNIASTKSAITYVDGEKGILLYRGYPIEDLCENLSFLEVAWLLFFGECPSREETERFQKQVFEHCHISPSLYKLLLGLSSQSLSSMNMLSVAITTLSSSDLFQDPSRCDEYLAFFLGKISAIVSCIFRIKKGYSFIDGPQDLHYESNFFKMIFIGHENNNPQITNSMIVALRNLLIIHADHEQNCSTASVRLVGSSLAGVCESLSAGVFALSGSRHGGANQKVLQMFQTILKDGNDCQKYIDRSKDPKTKRLFPLMGFGHRVYRNFDPRANLIRSKCEGFLDDLNIQSDLLDIAKKIEKIALKDPYFIDKKLYPNVDFYSGIIYHALGFPEEMFTVLFAMSRAVGWLSHWREMRENVANFRIGRPRQIYTGSPLRKTLASKTLHQSA